MTKESRIHNEEKTASSINDVRKSGELNAKKKTNKKTQLFSQTIDKNKLKME